MATKVSDFLQKNPQYIGYANTANRTKAPVAQQPVSKKGSGSLGKSGLSAWISELAGSGGALGGAAAGAAAGSVVPGLGNIIGGIAGGIIGGFGGGTAGRLAENKLRDNEYRVGDALKEGAVSGAFGAIGPSWQAARGLGALGKAGGQAGIRGGASLLEGMSDDAAKVAGKAIVSRGAKAGKAIGQGITALDDLAYASRKGMQSTGGKLRAVNRGIVAGNAGLSPDDVVRQNRALDGVNKWFRGTTKPEQFTNADDALKALTNTYKISEEGAQKFGQKNSGALLGKFQQNLKDNPILKGNLTKQTQQIVNNLTDDIAKFSGKNNSDFVEYMSKKINPRYRTISASGAAGSKESQILEAFRDAGKTLIDENMATRSGINKQFSNLLGATNSLGRTITRDAGAGAGQGLTLGRIAGNIAGGGMDVVGRGMQQAGKVTQFTTPIVKGALTRGLVGRASSPPQDPNIMQTNPDGSYQPANGAVNDTFDINDPSAMYAPQDALYGSMAGQAPPQEQNTQQPQVQYSLADALGDARRDPKNAAQYLAYAKAFESQSTAKTKASGPNVTKVTAQQYSLAQRGQQALQQMSELLQRDPGVLNRTATPGRKLPIVGGFISNAAKTGDFDAIGYNIASSLLRIETGAQANESEIKNLQSQMIPRAGDNEQTVARKLQQLNQAFSVITNAANNNYDSDLSSLISQYGGN